MQIEKINTNELTLAECQNIYGWDRTFELDGHTYAVVGKGDSQYTELDTYGDRVPCFNLKSRTIRALDRDQLVKPLRCKVQTRKIL